jgi:hypothetical protein
MGSRLARLTSMLPLVAVLTYRRRGLVLIVVLLTIRCGSSGSDQGSPAAPPSSPPSSPTGGRLEITSETIGDEIDPDGYSIILDGGASTPLAVSGSLDFEDLAPGLHAIEVQGIAPNCRLTNHPSSQDISIEGDHVLIVELVILCLRPNPGRILYSTVSGSIYTISALGGDRDQVTKPALIRAGAVAVSPADGRIAFDTRWGGAVSASDIWVVNADGSNPVNLTNTFEPSESKPSWSPDGNRIAYKRQEVFGGPGAFYDIFVQNPDGSGLTNLTNTPDWSEGEPAWSPDGTRIVFRNSATGGGELYTMRPDGTDLTQLTTAGNLDTNAKWSPDGSQLVFTRFTSTDFELFVINADGTGLTQLTRDPGRSSEPNWFPDGRWIVFSSRQPSATNGMFDLFLMRRDGSDRVQLTFGEKTGFPVWIPQ